MLKVAGSASLSFLFPAGRAIAYEFYSDMHRLARYLTHIELATVVSDYEYRMRFRSTELSSYHITILCDVRMELMPGNRTIRIIPVENLPPIEAKSTLNSTVGRGFFSSEAFFHDEGNGQTRIEYELQLGAELPRPLGMRFMPGRVVDNIAKNITNRRLKEIVQGFLDDSLADFSNWRQQLEEAHS